MRETIVILQARLDSTRLPRKALADLCGRPLLHHVIDRARSIPTVDDVVLATTELPADQELVALATRWGVPVYAGAPDDVLDRYYQTVRRFPARTIVRVTADCPLLDPEVSGKVLSRFRQDDVDYASNVHPPTYPDGLDTEVFSSSALERAWREAQRPSEREHVTPYFWKHAEKFRLANVSHGVDLSEHRWTVDEPEDLEFIRAVCERLTGTHHTRFRMEDVLDLLRRTPSLQTMNARFARNEGYAKSLRDET